eukprot:1742222-Pleurochrysis_carterae.AAC.1
MRTPWQSRVTRPRDAVLSQCSQEGLRFAASELARKRRYVRAREGNAISASSGRASVIASLAQRVCA